MHLRKTIPGFKRESVDCQHGLARMVWMGGSKRKRHSHFEGAMSFGHIELAQAFGRGQFNAINERLKFFKMSENWSLADKWTRGYWFTELVQASRETYFTRRWRKVTRLLYIEGSMLKALKTLPAAFASTDSQDKAARVGKASKELRHVKVDLDSLRMLRKWLLHILNEWRDGRAPADLFTEFPNLVVIERLHELTSKVIRMAKTDVAGHGYIAQQYVESPSGRLYANGVNLQNSSTLIKQAALAGLWEYDFSNCHFAIMQQMAAQYGYQCQAIAHYLANKKAVRLAIAEQAEITVSQAKVCLLAIMYGARASEWHDNAIPEEIGQDAARRLYQVPLFNGIKQDIAGARSAILKNWPRTANGSLTNIYGKAIAGSEKPAQKMAHLIQGVEAAALMVAINMHPNDIVLIQHDGFASTRKLYVPAIMEAVRQATCYRLELEETQIRVDPDTQFLRHRIKNDNRPVFIGEKANLSTLPVS